MMLINSTDAHLCYQPLKAPLNDSQMFLLCIFTVHVNTVIFSLSSFNCCNSKHLLRLTIQSGFGPVTYHCCFYSQDLFSSIRINTLFALNFEHQILCYLNKMNLHHLCNLIKKSFKAHNCDLFVFGPEFAMLRIPRPVWLRLILNSSAKGVGPQAVSPPLPVPVGSPP